MLINSSPKLICEDQNDYLILLSMNQMNNNDYKDHASVSVNNMSFKYYITDHYIFKNLSFEFLILNTL